MTLPGFEPAPTSEADWLDTLAERYRPLGVAVDAELTKMQSWLEVNPNRRPRNMKRFTVNWLNRATEDRGAKMLAGRMLTPVARVDWWEDCKSRHGLDADGVPVCRQSHYHTLRMATEAAS